MRIFFLLCILFFSTNLLVAQKDSIQVRYDTEEIEAKIITENQLTKYLDDAKFNYELKKVENLKWEAFKNWMYTILLRFFEFLFGVGKAVGFLGFFLNIIPYLLLAALLFFIIRFFINTNTRSILYAKQNQNLVSLSEEERIIKTEDIEQLIRNALKKKNYRLAIRYYYLFILKLLTEGELIDWQLQKTNDDYLKELKKTELKQSFKNITKIYDYIWYGEFHINEDKYKKMEINFSSMQKEIVRHD
ncbi:MAG: DUF4129 domain-containing protein [Flavobacteriaceae bacterium]|nr:MAG: DUF4129 domain-containing protein [Flavobacteriaceae bacterium]